MKREKLIVTLRNRYWILIGLNILILSASIASIVLFFVIIAKDNSNQNPYHDLDDSRCPKPNNTTIEEILNFFYFIFFVMASNFVLIEIKGKLTRNIKYNLLSLIRTTISIDDESDQLKTTINSFIQTRSKKYIGFVYLASLFMAYLVKLFAQCETFVTPIEIVSLITATLCVLIGLESVIDIIEASRIICKHSKMAQGFNGECDQTDIYKILNCYSLKLGVIKMEFDLIKKIKKEFKKEKIILCVFYFLVFSTGATIFVLFVISYIEYKTYIVINDFNETLCVNQYYNNSTSSKNPHYKVAEFNFVSLILSTVLFTITLASKNFLQKNVDSKKFIKMDILAAKRRTENEEAKNKYEEAKKIYEEAKGKYEEAKKK